MVLFFSLNEKGLKLINDTFHKMYSTIDLHIHSKEGSDGRYSVESIYRIAKSRGLKLISITDHDSTGALDKAIKLSKRYDIRLILGIEFSVLYNDKELHLLGYCFDNNNSLLQDTLKDLREYRERRIEEIVRRINDKLKEENLKLLTGSDVEEIKRSVDGVVGRPHIARHLIKLRYVSSIIEAFDKYLKKCDVPKKYLTIQRARELMNAANGLLFLAHPNGKYCSLRQFSLDVKEQLDVMKDILPFLDGIECYCKDHTENESRTFSAYAKKEGGLISSGSDCHQDPIKLGTVLIPEDDEKIILSQFL